MIATSAEYKAAVSAETRRFIPKVLVYFDGEGETPTTFLEDRIIDISLLEEAQAEGSSPLGAVSSNELMVSFDNYDRAFTPTNAAGPYYGKLLPNILVEPFMGLEKQVLISSNPDVYQTQYEWIPLGKYWTGDWLAPASSIEASTTCHDILYTLGAKDVPDIPVLMNTTLPDMFEVLFTSIGLTSSDYVLDANLSNTIIKFGWFEQGSVLNMLQTLAVSGGCTIFANRLGKVEVVSNLTAGASVTTLNDSTQIINAEAPQRYMNTFSKVDVIYSTVSIDEEDTVLSMDDVVIPVGGITLEKLKFSSAPIYSLKYVALVGAKESVITNISYGANYLKLVITNASLLDETVSIVAIGEPLNVVENTVTAEDAALIALIKEKPLEVKTRFIQNIDRATTYASQLLQVVTDPVAYIDVAFRGDPSLELMDTITIDDATEHIVDTDVIAFRYNLDFSGGALSMMASTIKRSTRP